jgi:hypothetical protein
LHFWPGSPRFSITQKEQQLRYEAEHLLRAGDVAAAFRAMSSRQRSEYPPIWDPPPRMGYLESTRGMT